MLFTILQLKNELWRRDSLFSNWKRIVATRFIASITPPIINTYAINKSVFTFWETMYSQGIKIEKEHYIRRIRIGMYLNIFPFELPL
ncbi:hypothetical protein BA6E_10924 [Bacteroidales bacterium 6E]|nr:hypothetical protein BA6E_10924 [Bacteroidales bacterium 6E]